MTVQYEPPYTSLHYTHIMYIFIY